jgi:TetR/AcrR family transcriptional regulator, transcriptional repressor of aconitase
MPKVSDEHKEQRRAAILEGARRCFARHGYEGATVARLEQETGLSRGAIFNYFENKEALFVALAVESSERLGRIWLEQGFRALLEAVVQEDPEWLSVQLEGVRRVRTDAEFRRLVEQHDAESRAGLPERLERLRAQGVRDDMPIEPVAQFLSIVANGLALRVTVGDPTPDLDALAELVETGVSPAGERVQRREWKAPGPRTRRTRRSSGRSSAG